MSDEKVENVMVKNIDISEIAQDKTLKDLLEFPCSFTFKVTGLAKPELRDKVVAVVQKVIPGDYVPVCRLSSKGTYEAVSITVQATSIEQIEILYKDLADIDIVRMVL